MIWPHGADTTEIDALIEAGFVISNVIVAGDYTAVSDVIAAALALLNRRREEAIPARSRAGHPCRRCILGGNL